ncbi:Permease Yjg/PYjgQ [Profundibacterium mesophilum KAUST100406-0324]|uniref:Permease Yjg/PYjgQ n=1 Tax=Profundibacterium mesophilum KAUST100406-0324 TaxID=1037889 RepID=A0A921NP33_9RHOB|nr:Permease Yjg/PYjgQ [Profundibacterium mesophilum KAUST100406-0324]
MTRFDRYLLSQLMMLFGFFSLVLILVYWVNQAVSLFDQIIANGHSAGVFLEFSALTLPNVIRVVLPVSGFAAAVYVTNRLSQDSEMVVAQAAGMSPARLARPVLAFGAIVALLVFVLTHVLGPASSRILAERTAELAEDVTAGLLSEGVFLHPGEGVTFYIGEISETSELREVFLSDTRNPDRRSTYTAERALLLRSEAGPKLVMFDGMVQSLRRDNGQLSVTRFDDFAFDIAALLELPQLGPRSVRQVSTAELLRAGPALSEETGQTVARLRLEGHERFAQGLVAAGTPLVGFALLLVGGFSRFGVWRQVLGAVICLIAVEMTDNVLARLASADAALWPLAYGAGMLAFAIGAAALWLSARPRGRSVQRRMGAARP